MNPRARQNAIHALIAALLMLVYGWGYGGINIFQTISPFYERTIATFNWMLKLGGVAMAVVAVACFMGLRAGLLLDVVVSGVCGLVMLFCAVTWLIAERSLDIYTIIILVFGGIFVSAARSSWLSYRESGAETADSPPAPPSGPEPIHPASIRPDSLPKNGEPPPADGYLAAMSRENQEPPTASYE